MNIKYFFMNYQVDQGHVDVQYCPPDDMTSDYMTKPLVGEKFYKFKAEIMNTPYEPKATSKIATESSQDKEVNNLQTRKRIVHFCNMQVDTSNDDDDSSEDLRDVTWREYTYWWANAEIQLMRYPKPYYVDDMYCTKLPYMQETVLSAAIASRAVYGKDINHQVKSIRNDKRFPPTIFSQTAFDIIPTSNEDRHAGIKYENKVHVSNETSKFGYMLKKMIPEEIVQCKIFAELLNLRPMLLKF